MNRTASTAATILATATLTAAGLVGVGFTTSAAHESGRDTAAAPEAGTYKIDPVHTSIIFRIRHFNTANFYGRFNEVEGTFDVDSEGDPSGVSITIPVESVDTGNENRDAHLARADFFNAKQFPTITFEAADIRKTGADTYEISGDLTMVGKTNRVTARLERTGAGTNARGAEIVGYEADFEIERGDFGLTTYLAPDGSDSGGLGNTVSLTFAVEAIKQ